jgi:hypothetical protein
MIVVDLIACILLTFLAYKLFSILGEIYSTL